MHEIGTAIMSQPAFHVPLYERIGAHYDVTRRADPFLVTRLGTHLHPEPTRMYLDIACGTGNYTVALAQTGMYVHGVDQSSRMIAAARQKSHAATWHIGNVEALPFRGGAFSGVMCTLAIHHFKALQPVFQEVFRVLAQGCFVLFTSTAEQMRGYWLNAYFPAAMVRSIVQMPGLQAIMQALRQSGFDSIHTEPYEVQTELQDLFLYSGKHRPEMYLDPRVRAGISTFAALADAAEVEEGCQKLSLDIASGHITEVMDRYRHAQGDYLFVIGEK
jgi:ubiquinone/menaquinone biosynthesis C-methylase UbiE